MKAPAVGSWWSHAEKGPEEAALHLIKKVVSISHAGGRLQVHLKQYATQHYHPGSPWFSVAKVKMTAETLYQENTPAEPIDFIHFIELIFT
jgi:hypothetical protein